MRNTRSWKHTRKDRKQYMRNGMCKVYLGINAKGEVWEAWVPVNTEKRNTEFMSIDEEDECL